MTEIGYIEVALHTQSHLRELMAAETAQGQIAAMDASGVDVAVLLPTYTGFLVYDDEIDAHRSRAYASAYNWWLSDLCRQSPTRLKSAAFLSRHDPERMVGDLEAGLKQGHQAVVLRPNPVCGKMVGAAELDPFFSACEANDVPLLLHEGTHTRVQTAGASRFKTHFAQHACSHPIEMMMAFLALLEGGVLERHPNLRVGFLESGCGWLPYWLWRLDKIEYAQLSNEVCGRVNRPPSEYFQRQCWIAMEPGEAMLDHIVAEIGPARIVFGTDFPHVDHGTDIVGEVMAQRAKLGDEALRAILWDSPSRLMGMGGEERAP
jgi:predicted TIM-barrel fold metal-dependent hydrolase